MGYEINSPWTKIRENDIKKLNKIIDNEYYQELEIGRKLHLMKQLERKFENELEEFDFDTVIDYMQSVGWGWSTYENGKSFDEVPTKERMIGVLRNDFLMHALYDIIELNKTDCFLESGGLVLNMGVDGSDVWCRIYFDIAHFGGK